MARRWRTLSVFPADFDAPAAAAIWELEPEPADTALGELVRRSLVDGDDGRYRLHDLARVFADSRCSEEERTGAQRRHAVHYRGVLAQARTLYLQGGAALLRGLRLVDLEWANIRAGQAWAADHAAGDQAGAELAWRYPHVGIDCLVLRLQPTELIGWLETALQAARHLGRREWEGIALGNLGYAYADLGETRRAIELYEQYLAIAREIGDRRGEANACWNLGLALEELEELGRSAAMIQVCVDYLREIGHPDAEKRAAEVEALRGRMGAQHATPD